MITSLQMGHLKPKHINMPTLVPQPDPTSYNATAKYEVWQTMSQEFEDL